MTESNQKEEFIRNIFDHNQRLIELVDNKAGIILNLLSILIPLIFGVNIYSTITQESNLIYYILNISFLVSIISLVISFFLNLFVVKARLKEYGDQYIFFKNIRKKSFEDYKKLIENIDTDSMFTDYIKEIHVLSEINKKKYKLFNLGLYFLIFGVSLLIIGYIISVILNLTVGPQI